METSVQAPQPPAVASDVHDDGINWTAGRVFASLGIFLLAGLAGEAIMVHTGRRAAQANAGRRAAQANALSLIPMYVPMYLSVQRSQADGSCGKPSATASHGTM